MKRIKLYLDQVSTLIASNKARAAAIALALTSITGYAFSEEIVIGISVIISTII